MEFKEPVPYKKAYLKGTRVRVADRDFLEEFKREWKYHHKLLPEQFEYAATACAHAKPKQTRMRAMDGE